MRYKLYQNGEYKNAIIADEAFCKKYCELKGYTYELIEEKPKAPSVTPTTDDIINTLLGVTK